MTRAWGSCLLLCLSCGTATSPALISKLREGQTIHLGEQTISSSPSHSDPFNITIAAVVDTGSVWFELLLVLLLLGALGAVIALLGEALDPRTAQWIGLPLLFALPFIGTRLAEYDDAQQSITIDTQQKTYQRSLDGQVVATIPLQTCGPITLRYKSSSKGSPNSYYRILFHCQGQELPWGTVHSEAIAKELQQFLSENLPLGPQSK